MAAQRKYPEELRERAVKMVFEIREQDGKGHGELRRRLGRLDSLLRAAPLPGTVNTVSDAPERWTQASVYPGMWADPGEDPRNSEGVSPDSELAALQDYLRNYRLTLLMKCGRAEARCRRDGHSIHPDHQRRAAGQVRLRR